MNKQKMQNENQEVKVGMGVFVIIFNKDFSKVLLLKRNEEKRKSWGADWGNIGGRLEIREYSIDGIIREAREEICLNIERDKLKLIEVKEMPNFSKNFHGIHFAYATAIEEDSPIRINDESDEFKWFEVSNLPDSMLDKKEDILRWRSEAIRLFKN